MTFPLYMHDFFGQPVGLVLSVVVGFFFGFVLERSGFGRASVLVSQFYLDDMRVLKVMFTAVVTAALGLAVLTGLGLLDMSLVVMPKSYLVPAIVGGLLVGAGFVISGYCPGTSVVAAASGNIDGLFAWLGIAFGSLVFAFGYPAFETLYTSTPLQLEGAAEGSGIRLPDLLGLPERGGAAVLSLGVLLVAAGAYIGAEKVERIMARRAGGEPPPGSPRVRRTVLAGLAAVGLLGLAPFVVATGADAAHRARTPAPISALDLAQALVREHPAYHLVDLRNPEVCAQKTIAGAMCRPGGDPSGAFLAALPPTRPLVLFGQGDLESLPEPTALFGGDVLVLTGGYDAFRSAVLEPPPPPADGKPDTLASHRLRSALHGHFTGSRAALRPAQVELRKVHTTHKKGGGC